MDEAFQTEKELIKIMKESYEKFEITTQPDIKEIVEQIFDFQGMKDYMGEMGLDLQRLPIGKLTVEKIKRGH